MYAQTHTPTSYKKIQSQTHARPYTHIHTHTDTQTRTHKYASAHIIYKPTLKHICMLVLMCISNMSSHKNVYQIKSNY